MEDRHLVPLTWFQFLDYTKGQGNDLITPRNGFPGLKKNDFWCLCSIRWNEAFKAGKAPKVNLRATHNKTVEISPLEVLKKYEIAISK